MRHQTFGTPETPDEVERSACTESVMSVLDEAVALYLRLRAVAEDIHGHGEISGAMRGVMRDLKKNGPQTVPRMARRRPVTRQHIQAIVNDLQRLGFVELAENPAHKRSRLVQLTPEGCEALLEIEAREKAALAQADIPVSVSELESTRQVLVGLREMLESEEWRRTVRNTFYEAGEQPRNPWIDDQDEHRCDDRIAQRRA